MKKFYKIKKRKFRKIKKRRTFKKRRYRLRRKKFTFKVKRVLKNLAETKYFSYSTESTGYNL